MTEPSSSAQAATVLRLRWSLSGMRRKVRLISGLVVLISLLGLLLSWLDPAIRAPLRPGLDFTGGTQIQLERRCDDACAELKAIEVSDVIRSLELPQEEGQPLPNLSAPENVSLRSSQVCRSDLRGFRTDALLQIEELNSRHCSGRGQ